mmetsp:Transcript_69061/g.179391  ORF Transcript_69061/g.179391 Transcript_69061/m.179391 type:complete len:350 (+) Transcript_69061:797-1846(+)
MDDLRCLCGHHRHRRLHCVYFHEAAPLGVRGPGSRRRAAELVGGGRVAALVAGRRDGGRRRRGPRPKFHGGHSSKARQLLGLRTVAGPLPHALASAEALPDRPDAPAILRFRPVVDDHAQHIRVDLEHNFPLRFRSEHRPHTDLRPWFARARGSEDLGADPSPLPRHPHLAVHALPVGHRRRLVPDRYAGDRVGHRLATLLYRLHHLHVLDHAVPAHRRRLRDDAHRLEGQEERGGHPRGGPAPGVHNFHLRRVHPGGRGQQRAAGQRRVHRPHVAAIDDRRDAGPGRRPEGPGPVADLGHVRRRRLGRADDRRAGGRLQLPHGRSRDEARCDRAVRPEALPAEDGGQI